MSDKEGVFVLLNPAGRVLAVALTGDEVFVISQRLLGCGLTDLRTERWEMAPPNESEGQ